MADQEAIHKLRLLSKREREVLKLFCEGYEYKPIGETFFISENTVKTHMGHIYIKLGLIHLPSSARKMIIHQTYCKAIHDMELVQNVEEQEELVPLEPESKEPEPVPDDVLEMVNNDERALVVVEPEVIEIPENDDEQPYRPYPPKTIKIQENPKKDEGKKKRRFWRWILFLIIPALLVFGGMQVYTWATGFITDVIRPMTGQVSGDQPQPDQVQAQPTSTTNPVVPTQTQVQPTIAPTKAPTSTPQPTSLPQPANLFSDNFDAGLSSGWQVAYGNPLVVNGLLTTDSDSMLIVGDPSWQDYAVEFDADAGFCWLSRAENWISVRATNADNNYAYKWGDCESFWYTVKNGSWKEIPKSGFSTGYDTLRFRIQAEGGNMAVYVDGMLMSSFFDNSFSQGKVILRISENTTIDNFVIKELE